jgi:AraC-like DNA-binding protein
MKLVTEEYPKIYLYRRIVQAKLFIDNHYPENIDLDNISDEAYFSKFHFIRLLKKIYGKTPHQYLIFVRIERATELLKSAIPVSEVCYDVGFKSLSSFCGLFKRLVGSTPAVYLLNHQKIKEQIAKSPFDFIPSCFAQKNGWLKD